MLFCCVLRFCFGNGTTPSLHACLSLSVSLSFSVRRSSALIMLVERYLMCYWGVWSPGLTGYPLSTESPNYCWSGAAVTMTTWLKFAEVLVEWGNVINGLSDKKLSWSSVTIWQNKLQILVYSFLLRLMSHAFLLEFFHFDMACCVRNIHASPWQLLKTLHMAEYITEENILLLHVFKASSQFCQNDLIYYPANM